MLPRSILRRVHYIVLIFAAQREEAAEREAMHLLRDVRGKAYADLVARALYESGLDVPVEVA